jgi:hypothetical protein
LTTSQDADDFAVHDTFAVTDSSLLLAAAAVKLREAAPRVSAAGPVCFPLCVTVNVRVIPPPFTVIFAVRDPVPEFAATLYIIFPSQYPLFVFTTNHEALDFAVHDTVDVTPNSLLFAAAAVNPREVALSLNSSA